MRHDTASYGSAPTALLTVDAVARYLSCSRRTVERLIERGELEPLRVGRRRRLRIEDVDAYVEGRSP